MDNPPIRAIIHVDMDAFYASVEQRDHPQYRGRPLVVGGTGGRGVVAAASYEARALGVHSAMPVARARVLAPGAVFVHPRIAVYREVSQQVFQVFQQFTPLVEGLSLDEAFLDVSGSLRLFSSREHIAAEIVERIRAVTGLHASVGMAHNKFLAKLASDVDKPRGFVSVPHDGVREFLDPMPVRRLWGIGKRTGPRLRAMGVLTIGQLRRTDPAVLATVLGNRTGHFLALARGEDDREVSPGRADKSISQEMTFSHDLLNDRELRAELLRQCESVMRRVRARHLAARTVHIKIRDPRFVTVTRSLSLRSPTASTRTLFQVARGLLQKWREANQSTPVRLLGVGVSNFTAAVSPPPGRASLDVTLDSISQRFGADTITRGLSLAKRKDK